MAHKIVVKDTVTGQCGLADPLAQPTVVAGTGAGTVVAGGTPTAPTYTVNFPGAAAAQVVTTIVDNGNGTFTYTNENAVAVTISICALASGLPNVGLLQP